MTFMEYESVLSFYRLEHVIDLFVMCLELQIE